MRSSERKTIPFLQVGFDILSQAETYMAILGAWSLKSSSESNNSL